MRREVLTGKRSKNKTYLKSTYDFDGANYLSMCHEKNSRGLMHCHSLGNYKPEMFQILKLSKSDHF